MTSVISSIVFSVLTPLLPLALESLVGVECGLGVHRGHVLVEGPDPLVAHLERL